MSEVGTLPDGIVGHIEQENEAPETGLICRQFVAEVTAGEGRTVDVRIVPYDEIIEHNDGLGFKPRGVAYREQWMPGVFAHQERAAFRVETVLANFEHDRTIAGVVGRGVSLREGRDGYYGSFKMYEDAAGDKALLMIRDGVIGGVSVEAEPVKSVPCDGIVQRVKANLRGLAFCRRPAFSKAVILAVREEAPASELAEDLLPIDIDPAMLERIRLRGVSLPERYKAHPAVTGTPAESGTPEDGTRLDPEEPTSEV